MKTTSLFLVIVAFILGTSCKNQCDCALITLKDNLAYKKETNTPYTGTCTYLYGDGKVNLENKYKEGKPVSSLEYTENGNVNKEKLYDLAGDLSSYKNYFVKDGNVGELEEEVYYKNGYLVSQKKWYSDDKHTLMIDAEFKEGVAKNPIKITSLDNPQYGVMSPSNWGPQFCKANSKTFYNTGEVACEIINPIEFVDGLDGNKKTTTWVVYLKQGYIREIGTNPNSLGFSKYVTFPQGDNITTATDISISLEDTKDIQKVIKSIETRPHY